MCMQWLTRRFMPNKPISIEQQIKELGEKILAAVQDLQVKSAARYVTLTSDLGTIQQTLDQIALDLAPEPSTASIANRFTGDSPMADNALVFTVGQTAIDTITPLLADGVTLSGGVVSAVVITFTDPSATFVLNADNTVTWTAVAAATAPVSGSTACTVTDTDGVVSTWNQPFTVLTNAPAPPPAQLTQSIANRFSTPTP